MIAAYRLMTNFLRGYFRGDESFASKRDFLEFLLGQVRALGPALHLRGTGGRGACQGRAHRGGDCHQRPCALVQEEA